jgi:hypothetical protein
MNHDIGSSSTSRSLLRTTKLSCRRRDDRRPHNHLLYGGQLQRLVRRATYTNWLYLPPYSRLLARSIRALPSCSNITPAATAAPPIALLVGSSDLTNAAPPPTCIVRPIPTSAWPIARSVLGSPTSPHPVAIKHPNATATQAILLKQTPFIIVHPIVEAVRARSPPPPNDPAQLPPM